MRFYLGTHRPHWLRELDVPLFVSHRRLRRYKRLPVARCEWALDSGGFTELSRPPHRWQTTVSEYLEAVGRYADEVGRLEWAAPMDWMCEPLIVRATGLSVREHQERTVANFLELRDCGPFVPVLQGWTLEDYERCVSLYRSAGVDLAAVPRVGLGSVCRRQSTAEVGRIVMFLRDEGISAHGFGVKKDGLRRYGALLDSADSLAWSFDGRYSKGIVCCHRKQHQNCQGHALRWRAEVLQAIADGEPDPDQLTLCWGAGRDDATLFEL